MKILHLPTTVGGNPLGLSQAERQMGLDSHCLDIGTNKKLAYQGGEHLKWEALTQFGIAGRALSHTATLLAIRSKYDIFHFNNGHTLLDYYPLNLNYLDRHFYPKNKKIIMTFNGGDVRQPFGPGLFSPEQPWDPESSYNHFYLDNKLNETKQARVKIIDDFADHIFTVNPDLFRFLPKRTQFLPYTISTWDKIEQIAYKPIKNRRLKIVHAPTDRPVKGTQFIIDAVNRLNREGHALELILVENLHNDQALKIYQQADIAIDQLFIGWYGAFAVEMMKMGKPVMAFIRDSDLTTLSKEFSHDCIETFIHCNPHTVYDQLRILSDNHDLLIKHSESSLSFVHQWHDPIKVSKHVHESAYLN
jgi:hypothetical protein